ncbi:MAG: hypothetical protein ACP5LR_08500 [Athalassotoga sp.]
MDKEEILNAKIELIKKALQPGEKVESYFSPASKMIKATKTQLHEGFFENKLVTSEDNKVDNSQIMVCLTNQRLMFIEFKNKVFSSMPKYISGNAFINLEEISSINWHKYGFSRMSVEVNGTHTLPIIVGKFKEMQSFVSNLQDYLAKFKNSQKGIGHELEELSKLAKEGMITQEEWERAKEMFLGKQQDKQEELIKQLGSLFELYKKGVLSEFEFNSKKWEVLSKK